MILIAVIDDHGGMMFNHRRQSQDRILRNRILTVSHDHTLRMSPYSAEQFHNDSRIISEDDFYKNAGSGDYCFVENPKFIKNEFKIEKIYLFHWNRSYPADAYFPIDLNNWRIRSSRDFVGYSHEKITEEIYER